MERGKACGVRSGLLVHEIVDIALAIDGDRFRVMLGDGGETHAPKEGMQLHRLWMRKLHECKTVGAHRVLRANGCGRRIVWKRTHAKILFCRPTKISRIGCKSCAKHGRITEDSHESCMDKTDMRGVSDLDAFDLRVLEALQENGRLSNQELGERIGLSASQCSRRRTSLEAAGLIRGYRADLAAERLGFRLLVFVQVALPPTAATTPLNFAS